MKSPWRFFWGSLPLFFGTWFLLIFLGAPVLFGIAGVPLSSSLLESASEVASVFTLTYALVLAGVLARYWRMK